MELTDISKEATRRKSSPRGLVSPTLWPDMEFFSPIRFAGKKGNQTHQHDDALSIDAPLMEGDDAHGLPHGIIFDSSGLRNHAGRHARKHPETNPLDQLKTDTPKKARC